MAQTSCTAIKCLNCQEFRLTNNDAPDGNILGVFGDKPFVRVIDEGKTIFSTIWRYLKHFMEYHERFYVEWLSNQDDRYDFLMAFAESFDECINEDLGDVDEWFCLGCRGSFAKSLNENYVGVRVNFYGKHFEMELCCNDCIDKKRYVNVINLK